MHRAVSKGDFEIALIFYQNLEDSIYEILDLRINCKLPF